MPVIFVLQRSDSNRQTQKTGYPLSFISITHLLKKLESFVFIQKQSYLFFSLLFLSLSISLSLSIYLSIYLSLSVSLSLNLSLSLSMITTLSLKYFKKFKFDHSFWLLISKEYNFYSVWYRGVNYNIL